MKFKIGQTVNIRNFGKPVKMEIVDWDPDHQKFKVKYLHAYGSDWKSVNELEEHHKWCLNYPKALKKRVFTFDTSQSDERYFRKELFKWCRNDEDHRSLTSLTWDMVHKINEEKGTIKYLFFNERTQRIYLDNDFFAWVKTALSEIEKALEFLETSKK